MKKIEHLIGDGEDMNDKHNFVMHVLLLNDDGVWVAQCLDYDIAAQGKTINKAVDALTRTFAGQVVLDIQHGKKPLEDFTKAPIDYWNKFEDANRLEGRKPFGLPKSFIPGGVGFAQSAIFA